MKKMVQKIVTYGSALTVTACVQDTAVYPVLPSEFSSLDKGLVSAAYDMQTCDLEEKVRIVELDTDLQNNHPEYIGVTNYANSEEIQKTISTYKVGSHVSMQRAAEHFQWFVHERDF
ncbi:MAG: hypothetical protein E7014_07350 [Alphaproteobacteria bacterium]|nr:hypothetical protein [Alphaproteobacteria bacterium]